MEVKDAIQVRRSVRSYEPKAVPDELLTDILEAGRLAPSANNSQPWHFIVVTDPTKREALSKGMYAKFLVETPVVIVGCADVNKSRKWAVVDVTIALQQMVLMATAEGLGTCWIGSFTEGSVRDVLKIPEGFVVVAMLALGYPKYKMDKETIASKRRRLPLESIVSREEFQTLKGAN